MVLRRWLIGVFATVLFGALPVAQAHGAWWRAHDRDADFDEWGLDHTGHEVSTATRVGDPSQVLLADVQWSGQQFWGSPTEENGIVTVRLRDADGTLVHESVLPAAESWERIEWVQCPTPPGGSISLETGVGYRLRARDVLDVGGTQRTSFCGNAWMVPLDPYYFRQFSDYTGRYTAVTTTGGAAACAFAPAQCQPAASVEVPPGSEWLLHLHVREYDHGG